jgi:hypothetical protein
MDRPVTSKALLVQVAKRILLVRGQNVMLDFELAELYGVETRALKQAVRRNLARFPADFRFELSAAEINNLVSQTVIPTRGKLGGATPMACHPPPPSTSRRWKRSASPVSGRSVAAFEIRNFTALRPPGTPSLGDGGSRRSPDVGGSPNRKSAIDGCLTRSRSPPIAKSARSPSR